MPSNPACLSRPLDTKD